MKVFFTPFCCAEEILQSHLAHWWSPDGLRLAYMTINDTLVPKMEIPFFTGMPYPAHLEYHYPKASLWLLTAEEQLPQLREHTHAWNTHLRPALLTDLAASCWI